MTWTTVYDFSNDSLRISWMLIPISFILIGYGISLFNIFLKQSKGKNRIYNTVFGIIFGTFALLFALMTIPHNLKSYNETKEIYESKKYKIIEGVVKNFKPMPYSGHQDEKFTLNGIEFSYSDFDQSYYGFNNTKSHGGPIDKNIKVRLSYFTSNNKNIILKIELIK